MRKIKLYIAISLDGKIAKKDGSVDWLESIPMPSDSDYGYSAFYASIDTTIQGYTTYKQVLDWGVDFPYPDKKNYVFTRRTGLHDTQFVEFVTDDHLQFVNELKSAEGEDIWLVGGGKLNAWFLEENLIDEIFVYVMPIILTDGIDMFTAIPKETLLDLKKSTSFSNGVVELIYKVDNQ